MIIGTMFFGKVKEVNKQWIETKFFVFGIPVAPVSSMLVTGSGHNVRNGMALPLNKVSIIAGFARVLTFIAAVILLAVGYFTSGNASLLVIGLVFAALWFYFYFVYGKATPSEIEERNKLGKVIGIYALPNWFDFSEALSLLTSLQRQYITRYDNSNWKTDLAMPNIPAEKIPLLYALAVFNYMVEQSGDNEKLFDKANSIYK